MIQGSTPSGSILDRTANAPPGGDIAAWLQLAGLDFDPFAPWEASADRRLSAYLVGNEAFTAAWGPWPCAITAAAGGGKTALRVRVSQACWVGYESQRPFPLSYLPPYQKWGHTRPSLNDHLSALAEAGGLYLLFTLVHRPHWFTRLAGPDRAAVRRCLDQTLPGPLERFLLPCLESGSPEPLYALQAFAPALRPPDPPPAEHLADFCRLLLQTSGAARGPSDPPAAWAGLVSVLLDTLQFPGIYLLCDGLDAAPGAVEHPEDCLASLLPQVSEWNRQHIYLKLFAPLEAAAQLAKGMPGAQSIQIEWDQDLLAEVVRRRIYKASRGAFGSLTSISVPDLWDLEFRLAGQVKRLPREVLVLCRRVVYEHLLRYPGELLLRQDDINAALTWYDQTAD